LWELRLLGAWRRRRRAVGSAAATRNDSMAHAALAALACGRVLEPDPPDAVAPATGGAVTSGTATKVVPEVGAQDRAAQAAAALACLHMWDGMVSSAAVVLARRRGGGGGRAGKAAAAHRAAILPVRSNGDPVLLGRGASAVGPEDEARCHEAGISVEVVEAAARRDVTLAAAAVRAAGAAAGSHAAVVQRVEQAAAAGISPPPPPHFSPHTTPLHLAVLAGSLSAVRMISRGHPAMAYAVDDDSYTPFMLALARACRVWGTKVTKVTKVARKHQLPPAQKGQQAPPDPEAALAEAMVLLLGAQANEADGDGAVAGGALFRGFSFAKPDTWVLDLSAGRVVADARKARERARAWRLAKQKQRPRGSGAAQSAAAAAIDIAARHDLGPFDPRLHAGFATAAHVQRCDGGEEESPEGAVRLMPLAAMSRLRPARAAQWWAALGRAVRLDPDIRCMDVRGWSSFGGIDAGAKVAFAEELLTLAEVGGSSVVHSGLGGIVTDTFSLLPAATRLRVGSMGNVVSPGGAAAAAQAAAAKFAKMSLRQQENQRKAQHAHTQLQLRARKRGDRTKHTLSRQQQQQQQQQQQSSSWLSEADGETALLAAALRFNLNLVVLDLGGCRLGSTSVLRIVDALRNARGGRGGACRSLGLRANRLGPAALVELARALQGKMAPEVAGETGGRGGGGGSDDDDPHDFCWRLEQLELASNDLTASGVDMGGVMALAGALRGNTRLRWLGLAHTKLAGLGKYMAKQDASAERAAAAERAELAATGNRRFSVLGSGPKRADSDDEGGGGHGGDGGVHASAMSARADRNRKRGNPVGLGVGIEDGDPRSKSRAKARYGEEAARLLGGRTATAMPETAAAAGAALIDNPVRARGGFRVDGMHAICVALRDNPRSRLQHLKTCSSGADAVEEEGFQGGVDVMLMLGRGPGQAQARLELLEMMASAGAVAKGSKLGAAPHSDHPDGDEEDGGGEGENAMDADAAAWGAAAGAPNNVAAGPAAPAAHAAAPVLMRKNRSKDSVADRAAAARLLRVAVCGGGKGRATLASPTDCFVLARLLALRDPRSAAPLLELDLSWHRLGAYPQKAKGMDPSAGAKKRSTAAGSKARATVKAVMAAALLAGGSVAAKGRTAPAQAQRGGEGSEREPERLLVGGERFVRDTPGLTALAGVVANAEHLRVVKLAGNLLGPEGGVMMAEAVGQSRSLRLLDVSSNGIKDAGAIALAAAMRGRLLVVRATDNGVKQATRARLVAQRGAKLIL